MKERKRDDDRAGIVIIGNAFFALYQSGRTPDIFTT